MLAPAEAEVAVDEGRLDELHDMLLRATADHDDAPRNLLARVGRRLTTADLANLTPRPLVALRLLAAGALDAAWQVLRDNAVGVVDESFDVATSSGARRTSWRLPLNTLVEPPKVYAWLPGLRDPRYDAPDPAYDITDLVTAAVRLDELWWDGPRLVFAGSAYLRHLTTSADDEIALVFTHADGGAPVVVAGERVRRPDLVRGTGTALTQRAWAGWSATCDARALRRPGLWKATLRLTQDGITRDTRLAPSRGGAAVPSSSRVGVRRAVTRVSDGRWVDLLLVDPLVARAPRRLLHVIASRARGR